MDAARIALIMFVLAWLVFVVWMLVDALRVRSDDEYQTGTKLVWVLVILLANGVGAVIYFFVGRPRQRHA